MNKFIVSITEAIEELKKATEQKFAVVMKHGTMSVEYFAPEIIDSQQPHTHIGVKLIFILLVQICHINSIGTLVIAAMQRYYFF